MLKPVRPKVTHHFATRPLYLWRIAHRAPRSRGRHRPSACTCGAGGGAGRSRAARAIVCRPAQASARTAHLPLLVPLARASPHATIGPQHTVACYFNLGLRLGDSHLSGVGRRRRGRAGPLPRPCRWARAGRMSHGHEPCGDSRPCACASARL